MLTHKIAVKLFVENPEAVDRHAAVGVFHEWIQRHALPDHLLIDVADYGHVHHGPGTLLISLEANIYLEDGDGELGLSYVRKQPFSTGSDPLTDALQTARRIAAMLEDEPALIGLRFARNRIAIRLEDRLRAPNTDETFARIEPDLKRIGTEAMEAPVRLDRRGGPEQLLEVVIIRA